jgi:hypothetical protein
MTSPTETPPERRASWPWLIGGGVVVVVAVVVTMVLTSGHAGSGDRTTAGPKSTAAGKPGYDLSSPEAAAESFVAAAKTGDGDTLLGLACVGRPACVEEHAAQADEAQVTEAQDTIREGVFELSVHLEDAKFTAAVDGDTPGTKNVPYRTPEMTSDAYLTLTFIKSGDDWLYYRPME